MRKTRKGKRSFFISTRLIFWLIFLCCHSSLCRSMVRNAQGQTKKMSQYSVEKNKTTEVSHFQHNRSLSYQTGVSLKGLSLRLTSTHYKNKPWNPWGEGGGAKELWKTTTVLHDWLEDACSQWEGDPASDSELIWVPAAAEPTRPPAVCDLHKRAGNPLPPSTTSRKTVGVNLREPSETRSISPCGANIPNNSAIWLSAPLRVPTHILRLRL